MSCQAKTTTLNLLYTLKCKTTFASYLYLLKMHLLDSFTTVMQVLRTYSQVPGHSVISTWCKSFVFSTNLRVMVYGIMLVRVSSTQFTSGPCNKARYLKNIIRSSQVVSEMVGTARWQLCTLWQKQTEKEFVCRLANPVVSRREGACT